jgi:hypothetical protein
LDAIEEKVHLTSRVVALENELAQAQVDLGDFQMQADYLSQQNSDLYTREQEHEQQKRELHGIIGSLQIQLAHAQGASSSFLIMTFANFTGRSRSPRVTQENPAQSTGGCSPVLDHPAHTGKDPTHPIIICSVTAPALAYKEVRLV